MINTIIWDFDGVIVNSEKIRVSGFRYALRSFSEEQVEKFIKYHIANGGLSRYHKIDYFFTDILSEPALDHLIETLLEDYSTYCLNHLGNKDQLITSNVEFLESHQNKYTMFLVSASDGDELKVLANRLGIQSLFREIKGSPTTKIDNVARLLTEYSLKPEETVLIGDSFNDFDAAVANSIYFLGFGGDAIQSKSNLPDELITLKN